MAKDIIIIESQFIFNYDNPEAGITVGGTQRYTLELKNLLTNLGYETIIVTKANKNLTLIDAQFGKIVTFDSKYGNRGTNNFSRRVYRLAKDKNAKLVIYSDILVSYKKCYTPSIAIQHGIAWDNPYNNKVLRGILNKRYIEATLKHEKVICVDTNFINWMRERSRKYFNHPDKLVYIPNFADEEVFKFSEDKYEDKKYKLLYPRRLVNHRGFDIFSEMCLELIKAGYAVVPIYTIDDFNVKVLYEKYPQLKEVEHDVVSPAMDEMAKYYSQAYLAYIPTRWSEGTSLSAIEATMVGCPIIASDVGGLSNVVIDGFNGYIVSPSVEEFKKKTIELINDEELRDNLRKNCKQLRSTFGLKRWIKQVEAVITSVVNS